MLSRLFRRFDSDARNTAQDYDVLDEKYLIKNIFLLARYLVCVVNTILECNLAVC